MSAPTMPNGREASQESVVVVGAGVGGLGLALALGRAGHRVTVLERDLLPEVADVEGEPDRYPMPAQEGPSRAELLAALSAPEQTEQGDPVHA